MMLEAADGSDLGATGFGQADIRAGSVNLNLKDVILAPHLHANFLSVNKFVQANFTLKFFKHNNISKVDMYDDKLVCEATEESGLFKLRDVRPKLCNINVKTQDNDDLVMEWHKRLGHVNFGDLMRLKSDLNIKPPDNRLNCETCDLTKCHWLPFQKRQSKTSAPLELIHTDTSGTIRTKNIHNYTSYVVH